MSNSGIIYCASGQEKYLREAIISAESVKKYCPRIPITLYTNIRDNDLIIKDYFDSILPCHQHQSQRPFLSRIIAYKNSPYDRTLALDTDTLIMSNIEDLFDVLDKFDIGAAHLPYNRRYKACYKTPTVPDSYSEFNCGVILFKKSHKVDEFFEKWLAGYRDDIFSSSEGNDQIYFRHFLYHSNLRIATLPFTYNCRYHRRSSRVFEDVEEHWKRLHEVNPTKIVHDRHLIKYIRENKLN